MIEKKLKNGQVVKAYPLSDSQKMMFLMSLKYGSGYPVNNIGCGYYWQGDLHIGILKESVYISRSLYIAFANCHKDLPFLAFQNFPSHTL